MAVSDLPRWPGRHELAARLIADPVEATLAWSACCWLPPPGMDPFAADPDFATPHLGDLPGFRHQDAGTHPEVQRHVERVMRAEDERLLTDPGEEVLPRWPGRHELAARIPIRLPDLIDWKTSCPLPWRFGVEREHYRSLYEGHWPEPEEESMPRPAPPCPLATEKVDWGNYCPQDPDGQHRCNQVTGEQHAGEHTCSCGARKPVINPFPPINSGIPWRAEQ